MKRNLSNILNAHKTAITNSQLVLGVGIVILILTLAITASSGYTPTITGKTASDTVTVTMSTHSTLTRTLVRNFSSTVLLNYTSTIVSNYTSIIVSNYTTKVTSTLTTTVVNTSAISSLSSLNSQMSARLNLQNAIVEASNVNIRQGAMQTSPVVSFYARYAGYVIINGTSTTSSGYIQLFDSYPGYPAIPNPTFGSGTASVLIPVLPGNVSIYFGNSNFFNGAGATISVYYYD